MIRERLGEPDARRGFILDGFPRNLAQAHALDRLLEALKQPLDAVVQLEVDSRELVRRIAGRRTCADCGRVFNLLTSPPSGAAAVCPKTGAPHRLMQRPDDNEATVAERLRVYDEKTRPLIDFYRARGLLQVIDAEADVDEVTARLAQALRVPALRAPKRAAGARRGAAKRARKPAKKKAAATAKRTRASRASPKRRSTRTRRAKAPRAGAVRGARRRKSTRR